MYYYINHIGMFPGIPTAGRSTSSDDKNEALATLDEWIKDIGEGEKITFECCPDE